jgi:hypothetical protein
LTKIVAETETLRKWALRRGKRALPEADWAKRLQKAVNGAFPENAEGMLCYTFINGGQIQGWGPHYGHV